MTKSDQFSFSGDSVASAYNNVLVPVLFKPWAISLIEEQGPWEGRRVLDLATGTGIVAQLLAQRVGSEGKERGGQARGADTDLQWRGEPCLRVRLCDAYRSQTPWIV